ncbi:MAG: hypothetical protein HYS12_11410 [Planctomycetes bacterium]|nr:hypothetical protein [Planctomycetota bacterium]
MTAPPARTTPITWSVQQIPVGSRVLAVARLRLRLFFRSAPPRPRMRSERCWLDTGAPLSVIPFYIHHGRLSWQATGMQTTWAGQPCDLGEIDVWLPTRQRPTVRGPFPMLAKFPRSDPPGERVPVLLGLEFFLANQAGLLLGPPPQQGSIQLP